FMTLPGEQFNLPPLYVMFFVVQCALKKFHHGIKLDDVYDLFDDYIDEGYGQTELMSDIIVPLFELSGFIHRNNEKE
ncbi:DUF6096 family protein, partial [Streptococcus suis]